MDDGAEIWIFNTQYPDGTSVPGSLVQLGGSLNFNFSNTDYIDSPGTNRIVIVQVDDCPVQNNIVAQPILNGNPIIVNTCPDGQSCNDNNPCTTDDTCQSGACVGDPVVCTAEDQCHDAGICDTSTGVCSNPTSTDGTPCEDGNACSDGDTCSNGECVVGEYICCHTSKGCGLCVADCDDNYEVVLDFFGYSGTECDVIAGGSAACTGKGLVCCIPKYQSTSYYSSYTEECSVPTCASSNY